MNHKQILLDVKGKKYKPVYFLMGEEAYYIDYVSKFIEEHILEESEKDFNQSVFYGKDVNLADVINLAKQFPMMAEHQVLIVREAQYIKSFDVLETYLKNPQPSTILVFCYKGKKLDKRKSVAKLIDKTGVLFDSKKLYENQVPDWISSYAESKGCKIEPKASILLSEFLGNDLSKIANELEKLMLLLPVGSNITPSSIEENIGISKDYNTFELNNALGKRDQKKALTIGNYFANNPKSSPFVVTISTLYNFYSKVMSYHFLPNKSPEYAATALKVNRFFVKDYELAAKNYHPKQLTRIFQLLSEYDLKSKGVGNPSVPEGELLKELILKILR